uniref:Uncharacterized protein n=1 Tax=Anguilla anguilla TaxID=7936 RepID=A0A0E9QM02_ANGAN
MAAHTKKAFEIFVSKIPWTLASSKFFLHIIKSPLSIIMH